MYGYDRISQIIEDPNLRASDAEREAIADRLREHHIDGRLDQDEFQARLDGCFAAKTAGELAELTRDLPADPARRGSGTRTNFGLLGGVRMIPIVPIILAIVAIHLVVGVVSGLWILIPLFSWPASQSFAADSAPGAVAAEPRCSGAADRTGGLVAAVSTRAAGPEPRPVKHHARLPQHRRPPCSGT